jgi:hypothetical protein
VGGRDAGQRRPRGGARAEEVRAAQRTGEEYLLERGLYRRKSTGVVVDPRMTMLSFPVRWFYDILRGLEHFRRTDLHDPRLEDAVELLREKADAYGLFPYENCHEGATLFRMDGEGEGMPSRWLTLRALRVLRWWDAGE